MACRARGSPWFGWNTVPPPRRRQPARWVAAGPFGATAVARVRLGRLQTSWLASGGLSLDGVRHALGGPGRWRATRVADCADGCEFVLAGRGLSVRGTVTAAARTGRLGRCRLADGSRDIVNYSMAMMAVIVLLDGGVGRAAVRLRHHAAGAAAGRRGAGPAASVRREARADPAPRASPAPDLTAPEAQLARSPGVTSTAATAGSDSSRPY
jgi:hypothetical protein